MNNGNPILKEAFDLICVKPTKRIPITTLEDGPILSRSPASN